MSDKKQNQSWLRREDETNKQFDLFQTFLYLPPSERTSLKVAEKFRVSERYISRIRSEKNWNERTRDFDNFLAVRASGKVAKVAEEKAFDWEKWEQGNIEKTVSIVDKLFAKCDEILNYKTFRRKFDEKPLTYADGEPILDAEGKQIHQQIVIIEPIKFSAGDGARMAEAAVLMSQFLMMRQRQQSPLTHNAGLPEPSKPLDDMSPDELEQYALECRAASAAIARGETINLENEQ